MFHPLPITTFGEIAALGLEAEVHCSSCYRQTKVDMADRRLNDRVFAAAPFRCSGMRDRGFAVPLQPCGAPGFVYIKPAVLLPVGGEVTLIFLSCPRCVPPWFIEHMPADRPPGCERDGVPTTAIAARPAEAGSIGASMDRRGGRPTPTALLQPLAAGIGKAQRVQAPGNL
jgi:hypothetical protein